MNGAKRIIVARKRPGNAQWKPARRASEHQSAVVRWELDQVELHDDLFVLTIKAIAYADTVRCQAVA